MFVLIRAHELESSAGADRTVKALGAIIGLLALGGCATVQTATCPMGQSRVRTAEVYFNRAPGGRLGVSEAAFRRFVADELTPRFPQGLTVLDGGPQWRGKANQALHDAAKVALIALPGDRDPSSQLEAVRGAYHSRFQLDSTVKIGDPVCAAL